MCEHAKKKPRVREYMGMGRDVYTCTHWGVGWVLCSYRVDECMQAHS